MEHPSSTLPPKQTGPIADWWTRSLPTDLPLTGPIPAIGHEDCSHRRYRLTCHQYNELLVRAGGACEKCGLPDHANYHGRLYIDHDPDAGLWAVRGLLCRTCNNTLRFEWSGSRRYLERSWHLGVLTRAGVGLGLDEPALGQAVTDHALRLWGHAPEEWIPLHGRPRPIPPRTWRQLVTDYGPHNLKLVHSGAPRIEAS